MQYRTPKVLEKKPIVAGFDLKIVVTIVICALLFLFTVFTQFLISLIFPIVCAGMIYLQHKFPGEGELISSLLYPTKPKCFHINRDIRNMLTIKYQTPIKIKSEKSADKELDTKKSKFDLGLDDLIAVIQTKITDLRISKREVGN